MDSSHSNLLTSLPSGYRAVIIGASGGIGSAILDHLRNDKNCADVIGLSRRHDGLDLTEERSIEAAAKGLGAEPIQLLICATGVLGIDGHSPEKALRQVEPEAMLKQFAINAVGPALIAKHFLPLLDRKQRAIAAFLSARVGSIGDNRLGGWMSYRASKAALNQIVHTAAIEYARTHPQAVLGAIHPGTVRTKLSEPFAGGHRTVAPDEAAASILTALDGLTAEASGTFIAYDGSSIPW